MLSKKTPPVDLVIFVVLCLNAAVMYIDRTNMSIAVPLMQRELRLNNLDVGTLFAGFSIAYAAFMIVGGRFGDAVGPRRGLAICGLLWAAGTLATGLAGGFIAILLARFVVGMGEAAVYPISSFAIARWVRQDRRGAAQGFLHGSGRLGAAATPIIVTALIISFSWRSAFIALAAVSLAVTLLLWWWLRDTPHEHPSMSPEILTRIGYSTEEQSPKPRPPLVWREFIDRVWPATSVSFCYGWLSWFLLSWVPLYFVHAHGLNIKRVAIFSTLVLIGGVLGMICGGFATDWWLRHTRDTRRARRDLIVVSFTGSMLCIVPLLLSANLMLDVWSLALAYFLIEFADPSIWMLGMEVLPSHASTSTATVNTGFALAGFVSPVVTGWLLDVTDGQWGAVFGASIAVLLLGLAAAWRVRPADALVRSDMPAMLEDIP